MLLITIIILIIFLVVHWKLKRDREDNGGRNPLFYTPHTTTELLRELNDQIKTGKIKPHVFARRRKKTLRRFMQEVNFEMSIKLKTDEGIKHLKELSIMRNEQLITEDEYLIMYNKWIKRA